MKKILTLAALLGTASMSFGQGYVGFNNASTTRVSTNGTLQAAAPAGTWYYALLVAPSTQNTIDSSFTGWTFVGYGTNTALAGRMTGNSSPDSSAVQVAGFGPTATADFAVIGWSASIGADWTAVRAWWNNGQHDTGAGAGQAGWFGISSVANDIPLAPSGGPYNGVFGSSALGQVQGMNLSFVPAVPEPTTFALAGLGAAALVIFRRRKA
jgi:hypothetical protein